jgi:hypothetical protein
MTDENKASRHPAPGVSPGERNPGVVEEATIPDYVMLDFADDFFPDEAANSRLRKPQVSPELFG